MVKHLTQNDAGSKDIPQVIVMDTNQSPSNFDDVDLKGKKYFHSDNIFTSLLAENASLSYSC